MRNSTDFSEAGGSGEVEVHGKKTIQMVDLVPKSDEQHIEEKCTNLDQFKIHDG